MKLPAAHPPNLPVPKHPFSRVNKVRPARLSRAQRSKIVSQVNDGVFSVTQVSRQHGIARKTIYSWLKKDKNGITLEDAYVKAGAHPRAKHHLVVNAARNFLAANPGATVRQLAEELSIAISTAWLLTKRYELTSIDSSILVSQDLFIPDTTEVIRSAPKLPKILELPKINPQLPQFDFGFTSNILKSAIAAMLIAALSFFIQGHELGLKPLRQPEQFISQSQVSKLNEEGGVLGDEQDEAEVNSSEEELLIAENNELRIIQKQQTFKASEPASFTLSEPENGAISRINKKAKKALGVPVDEVVAESLSVSVKDAQGRELPEDTIQIQPAAAGSVEVEILADNSLVPGVYSVEFEYAGQHFTQDFAWGVLALNTDKSAYRPGESAQLDMAVLDPEGAMVCDAALTLEIATPELGVIDVLSTATGSIAVNPECYSKDFTLNPDYQAQYALGGEGSYQLRLTAETEHGSFQISDSIEVRQELVMDIRRETATRIYPPHEYPVKITVTPESDFAGTITETIPAEFMLHPTEEGAEHPYEIVESGDAKKLMWQVNLSAGESRQLEYYYKAPDVSPEFYILGPLQFTDQGGEEIFEEGRQWQIAADDVAFESVNEGGFGGIASSVSTDTVTAATDNLYIASITSRPSRAVTSVTGLGLTWTQIVDSCGGRDQVSLKVFAAIGNPTGNGVVTANIGGGGSQSAAMTVTRISGVDTSDPIGSLVTANTNGVDGACSGGTDNNSPSLSITTSANDSLLYGVISRRNRPFTPTQDFTLRAAAQYGTGGSMSGLDSFDKIQASAGTVTVSGSVGGNVDWAMSAIEVKMASGSSLSGTVYSDQGSTAIGSGKTVNVRLNGAGSYTAETDANGVWSVSGMTPSSGDVITAYLDGETEKAATVLVSDGSLPSDLNLYQNHLIVRDDNDGTLNNDDLYDGDDSDSDVLYGVSGATGGNLSVDSDISLYVWGGDEFAPGGNVTTQGTSGHLVLGNSATFTAAVSAADTVSGDVVIGGSAELVTPSSGSLTIGGSLANSGTITATGGSVIFNSGSSETLSLNGSALHNVTFENAVGSWALSSNLAVNGVLDISAGTFNPGAYSVTLNGSSTPFVVDGTFSAGSSTVIYKGTTATNVTSSTYHNLEIIPESGTPEFTATAGTTTVGGNFILSGAGAGTFSANTNDPAITIGGDLVINTGQTFSASDMSLLTVTGNMSVNGTFTHNFGSILFNATSSKIISGSSSITLGNSEFDGVGGIWQLPNDISFGNLTITNGTITAPVGTMVVRGSYANNGSFTANGGLVSMQSAGMSTLSGSMTGGNAFHDLVFANAGGSWTFSSNADLTGSFVITSATAVTAPASLSVAGDFTGSSAFVPGTGAVALSGGEGTTQTLSGDTEFYDLSASADAVRTIQFEAGDTFAFANSLSLLGSSCTEVLQLRSTIDTSAYTIDVDSGGSATLSYLSIRDLTAASALTANNSEDLGGNSNITINGGSCATATSDSGATANSFQRKTFYDDTNEVDWTFFHDGSKIKYNYSANDGSSWSTRGALDYSTADFSVWESAISGTHYVWVAITSGDDIVVRRGTLTASAITWDSENPSIVAFDGSGSGDAYSNPYISLDSSNYIWVGARHFDGTNYTYKTIRSDNTAATTWSSMAFGSAVEVAQISDSQTDANVYGNIVPLPNQEMYAAFVTGTELQGCKWVHASTDWQDANSDSCIPVEGISEDTASTINSGLTSYYKFDEASWSGTSGEIKDSALGNDGVRAGNATTALGGFNRSGSFDGNADYANFGNNNIHDISLPFTLSAWINLDQLPSSKGSDAEIMSKYSISPNRQWTFAIGIDNVLYFWASYNGTNGQYPLTNGYTFTSADVGIWRQVALTADSNGAMTLYLDGEPVDTGTLNNPTIYADGNTNFLVGARANPANYFDGSIDEVRIYNRALSGEEMEELAAAVPTPNKIDDAGDPGALSSLGRQSVRTSDGTLYSFINDGGSCEVWKSATGSTWIEVDSANNPLCANSGAPSIAVDSSDTLHLLYPKTVSSTTDFYYRTLNTTTDTFAGSEELVFDQSSTGSTSLEIVLDANDVPHAFKAGYGVHYSNRVNGSWDISPVELSASPNTGYGGIVINEDNVPEIVYASAGALVASVGNQNDAASFTTHTIDSSVSSTADQQGSSIVIDKHGNTWIAYIDSTCAGCITLVKHNDADAWTTWQTPVTSSNVGYEPALSLVGSTLFVLYENDDTYHSIAYDAYDAGTSVWRGEEVIVQATSGTDYQDAKVRYARNNFHEPKQMDVLFSNGTDVFWMNLDLTEPVKFDDAGNPGSMPGNSSQLVRSKNGSLFAFVNDGGNCEMWRSSDGFVWSHQASGTAITCNSGDPVTMAIDSNDAIHVAFTSGASVKYRLFDIASSAWNSLGEETVYTYNSVAREVSIAVDASNKPHLIANGDSASYTSVFAYKERTSGTWEGTYEIESPVSHKFNHLRIIFDETNNPNLILVPAGSVQAYSSTSNPASTFVPYSVSSINTTADVTGSSHAINSDTNEVWIAYVATNDYIALAKHTGSAWNVGWSTITTKTDIGYEPSIAVNGTNIYVFYENDQDDIAYDVYDSVAETWRGEEVLHAGTYQDVKVKWSTNADNFGPNRLDYTFSDGTDVYWDYLEVRNEPVTIDPASNFGVAGTGLVSHYKMNELSWNGTTGEVRDTVGNNHGTAGTSISTIADGFDRAADFSTNGNRVTIPDPADESLDFTGSESFSVSFWVKGTSIAERQHLVIKDPVPGWLIQMRGSGENGGAYMQVRDGTVSPVVHSDSVTIGDGVWHHVVAVRDRDAGKLFMYVDGILTGETNDVSGDLSNTRAVEIGGSNSYPFGGQLDEVKIYERTLSPEEIASMYQVNPRSGRQIVRTSSGDLYTFVNKAGSCEMWRSNSAEGSWTRMDASTAINCSNSMAISIDSDDSIHVVYSASGTDAQYRTFSTATNVFGTAATLTGIKDNVSISLDTDKAPHIIGRDSSGYLQYKNKVGGSWNSTVTVETAAVIGADIALDKDSKPQISYVVLADGDLTAAIGSSNNPTSSGSFTKYAVDTNVSVFLGGQNTSIGIDAAGNTWIAYLDEDGADDYISLSKHTYNTTWDSGTNWSVDITNSKEGHTPSLAVHGNTAYVLYPDYSGAIRVDSYDGSDWAGVTILENHGDLESVKSVWNYQYEGGLAPGIDYLYSNGTDLYYNHFSLISGAAVSGSQDAIDTVPTGFDKNLSAVSDSAGNVHLLYVLDGANQTAAYKQKIAAGGWDASPTQLGSSSDISHVSLSLDTAADDLYAVWSEDDTSEWVFNYSQYDNSASDWQNQVSWQGPGNFGALTTNYSDSGRVFGTWTTGSGAPFSVEWDLILTPSSNNSPVVSNVQLNNDQAIILTPGQRTEVSWTATITDIDGYDDISTVAGKAYRSNVAGAESCSANDSSCYEDVSCSLSFCSGSSCTATCTADFAFFADPTDSGSPLEAAYWRGWIEATDDDSQTGSGYSGNGATELQSVTAMSIGANVEYGSLLVGESSITSSTVTSTGNRRIDLEISGDNMCTDYPTCSGNSIAVGNQEFSGSIFTYGSGTTLTISPQLMIKNIPVSSTVPSNSTDSVYWGIMIPQLTPQGIYTGSKTISAVNAE